VSASARGAAAQEARGSLGGSTARRNGPSLRVELIMKLTAVDPCAGSAIRTHEATAPAEVPHFTAAAAAAAAVDPHMADTARRASALQGIVAALDQEGDEVLACFEAEIGLPRARAEAELVRTCGQLEALAAVVEAGGHLEPIIDRADPDATPTSRPDLGRMRVPRGPVAEAGLPDGSFATVQGSAPGLGAALVEAPEIAAVGVTGSFAGGRALSEPAARRPGPIPVYAEMGSTNPVVVTDAALQALYSEPEDVRRLVARVAGPLAERVGRVVFDGFPTGAAVTWAMHHGGPYPATTPPGETSVGMTAARRFMRPVCSQDALHDILPAPLRDGNPDGIWRRIDRRFTPTEAPVE